MGARVVESSVPRMPPTLTEANRSFWTGGSEGALLIQRCRECRLWVHPPEHACPACGGEMAPEPVSGEGTVFTYTVNMHQFHPDVPPPNMIAIVTLSEQEDLRIPTGIVACEPADLRCGLPVRVLFERHGEIYYPLFEPAGSGA
jgi:uncharacterized OB-fold protein